MENTKYVNLKIQDIISSIEDKSFENFKTIITQESNNIIIKEWDESDLFMLTNNFIKNNNNLSDLERECRSIILSKSNLKIVCYTYDDIYYNQDAKDFLIKNIEWEKVIQECFEGTLLSVYFYNDKWNISTRRCIDASNSIWMSNKSYLDMFLECINVSLDEFTSYLREENNYYFVLVHYQNKHIVDYSDYFGEEDYKKIIHVMTRNQDTNIEISLDNVNQWKKKPVFFSRPKNMKDDQDFFEAKQRKEVVDYIEENNNLKLEKVTNHENFSKLDELNKNNKLDLPVTSEGLIVKMYNPNNNKTELLKFQTNSYQFMSILKPNSNNIFMSFIELYQNDMLKRHLEYFPGNCKFEIELYDGYNEIFDTIGVVDAAFKVKTSELFELFRTLYNLKDCSHKNKELYSILPTEYTIALYRIRGIYYKKKEKYIKSKQEDNSSDINNINTNLRIFDIYNMLKYTYETKELLKLFRARKILLNKCMSTKNDLSEKIINLSHRCDKVSIKMTAILLNKMFPKDQDLDIYSKKSVKRNITEDNNVI